MKGKKIAILGCGYVGLTLARILARQGADVVGTSRQQSRAGEIEDSGARAMLLDVMEPGGLTQIVEWEPDVLFDMVRPQQIGEDRYTTWGTRNVSQAFADSPLEALVYVSSTSVYGRRSGEWTDEETPVNPSSPLGQARVESENLYLETHRASAMPVRICRVPGIYGPGRTLRQRLETGAYRRLNDQEQWVSRIHVDDLAEALIAAWIRGRPGAVYLLCDDEPVSGQEYAELTASLLALPLPPTVDREDIRQELSSSAFERRVAARRCSNRLMREELQVFPRFPSVRQGIPAALRAEGAI
ncbi:SDR family oxidoreductase [soil metagenome]